MQSTMASGISKEDKRRKVPGTGTRNRYQEQKYNMRTTCASPTTIKKNRNRTRGVTTTR